MANEKFTPGPWKVTDDGFVTAGDKYVHEPNALGMEIPQAEIIPEEVLANCRLIAVSPKMYRILTALELMYAGKDGRWWNDFGQMVLPGSNPETTFGEAIKEALAKARGE